MTTLPINEKVQDNGHDSASEAAREAEADRSEAARAEGESRKRSPVYHVFEDCRMIHSGEVCELLTVNGMSEQLAKQAVRAVEVQAWAQVGGEVNGATDRKAIESIIGTAEDEREGYDAKRRLHRFVAVLTRHWEPRQRKRTVTEDWC